MQCNGKQMQDSLDICSQRKCGPLSLASRLCLIVMHTYALMFLQSDLQKQKFLRDGGICTRFQHSVISPHACTIMTYTALNLLCMHTHSYHTRMHAYC